MSRLGIIGFCIATVMVMSTFSAALALAQPEFKTAVFPVSYTVESVLPLEPVLASLVGSTHINVLCLMSTRSGQVATSTSFSKVLGLYTGCKIEGSSTACTTVGQASGMITTKTLGATTGFIEGGSGDGILLGPEDGTKVFAEFNCGALIGKVTVENSIIEEVPHFNFGTMFDVVFEENAAKNGQRWAKFVGGPLCELTINRVGKGWLMERDLITTSAPVELS